MKVIQHIESENFSTAFLYLTFMFIHIDYVGILDYLIKALAGAMIWFGFKYLQEHLSAKMKHKLKEKHENKEEKKP